MRHLLLNRKQIELLVIIIEPVLEDWDWSNDEIKELQKIIFKLKQQENAIR